MDSISEQEIEAEAAALMARLEELRKLRQVRRKHDNEPLIFQRNQATTSTKSARYSNTLKTQLKRSSRPISAFIPRPEGSASRAKLVYGNPLPAAPAVQPSATKRKFEFSFYLKTC